MLGLSIRAKWLMLRLSISPTCAHLQYFDFNIGICEYSLVNGVLLARNFHRDTTQAGIKRVAAESIAQVANCIAHAQT
jgi:hypothetical protein